MERFSIKTKYHLIVLTLQLIFCASFNVDLPSYIMHASDQSDSMFGFSVALYKYGDKISMLVGAPKYDTRSVQPGVQRGGAVLNCGLDYYSKCDYVPFDRNGNNVQSLGIQIDNKSNQFFGATVKTSYKDGLAVACAPRYVWFTETMNKREPVGTCYVASNGLKDFQEFSPCRTSAWGYHKQGSCQAGFDAAITKNGDRMFIGAPGAYYWQGQVHAQQPLLQNEYLMTGEGPASEDDQYLGYSVATGDFNGDGLEDVVLGVPKGLNYTGKIALYSNDLVWIQNITGSQMGSYFGYSLCVVDFNNDGLDDIVIGAPMYTDMTDREMKIEVGRVHILLQNFFHRFDERVILTGTENKGRFGLAVASLGDINLDSYDDIAVGAPYGGDDGRGAVYIYHGFSEVVQGKTLEDMTKPVQIIRASSFGRDLATFGWSLAGGLDVDSNEYPDLLVGAYESERAFLLRSRPIIKFTHYKLEFETEGQTVQLLEGMGKIVDMKSSNCKIPGSNIDTTCLKLKFCLTYSGVNVDNSIEMDVEYKLDSLKTSEQRLLFETNQKGILKEKLEFHRSNPRCRHLKTYVNRDLEDKLTPISAEVSYTLIEKRSSPRILTAVLNERQQLTLNDSVRIKNDCGHDQICIPDLQITFDAPDTFVLGKNEMLSTDIRINNGGEDAFESIVYISEPEGLLFNKLIQKDNTSIDEWATRVINGSSFIVVDVGNPLKSNQAASFTVMFQQAETIEQPRFEFLVKAESKNPERGSLSDNVVRKVVEAKIDAELIHYGSSEPDTMVYNKTLYDVPLPLSEEHIGPSLVHKYGLLSNGPSDVEEVEIIILWPSKTLSGSPLLYLMEQPITIGDVKCEHIPGINPFKYRSISLEQRAKLLGLANLKGYKEASTGVQQGSSFSSSSSKEESHGTTYQGSSTSSGGGYRGASASGGGGYRESSSSSGGGYESSSSGGYSKSSGYGGHSSFSKSSSSGSTYNTVSKSYESSSSSSSSSSEGSYSRSGTYSGHPSYRSKRDLHSEEDWRKLVTECGPTRCTKVKCHAKNLAENNDIYIYMRSRLFVNTLEEDPEFKIPPEGVTITSRMVSRAKISSQGFPADSLKISSKNVTTPVKSVKYLGEAPPIPWWVILLATLAGLLILLILILILYKCGYFKRHRPRHKAKVNDHDSQPLNPANGSNAFNGRTHFKNSNRPFYPGDEAL